MAAWVYMLRCSDGSYYVGSHRGEDVTARVWEHQNGVYPKAYTFRRRPVELVWSVFCEEITDAIAFERKIKGWSRPKKEALIRGDWGEVERLARGAKYVAPDLEARLAAATERDGAAVVLRPRPSTGSG